MKLGPIAAISVLVLGVIALSILRPSLDSGDSQVVDAATIDDYPAKVFSPAIGEVFEVPFTMSGSGQAILEIYTSDNDLVREISSEKNLSPGKHALLWDGKDMHGLIVPDEAYIPVLKIRSPDQHASTITVDDSRDSTGGEHLKEVNPVIETGKVSFNLTKPGRVLIRAGIKSGPLLRTIQSWKPHSEGTNVVHWDGMDEDKVEHIENKPKLTYLVLAFALPDNAIITYGNEELDYRAYRKKNNWPFNNVAASQVALEREGKPLLRNASYPVYRNMTPRIAMKLGGTHSSQYSMKDKVQVTVDIHPDDRWVMEQAQYEIGFFVDGKFISEEEQGFVPFVWTWTPQELGIKPGEHQLTVNVSGFGGEVGVANKRFHVN